MNRKEDQILLAWIEDKIWQCSNQYKITHTNFLDLRQRTLVAQYLNKKSELRYLFYGGYEEAERTIALFFPTYMELEIPGADNPLKLLRIYPNSEQTLSHRDYLGALLGLGIKRETIGDILIAKEHCDVILLEELGSFLSLHLNQVGKVTVQAKTMEITKVSVPEARTEQCLDTVASLRLDNLIASAFSFSRTKAAEAITSGMIFLDGMQVTKADHIVREGQKLVCRGKGKVLLKEITGNTKKGRIRILLEKYQ